MRVRTGRFVEPIGSRLAGTVNVHPKFLNGSQLVIGYAGLCGQRTSLYAVPVRRLIALHSRLPLPSIVLAFLFAPALQTPPRGDALAFG